jgi:hypothetical protein
MATICKIINLSKVKDMTRAGNVLKNLMESHVRVYRKLKPKINAMKLNIQIGLVKSYFQFDPYNRLNILE